MSQKVVNIYGLIQPDYAFKGNAHASEIRTLLYIYKMLILLKMVIVTFKMYQFCFVATCTDMKKFGKASLILFQKKQEEGEHLYISSLSAVIGP